MGKVNKNCNVGDVVQVRFLDHAEGASHIFFEIFGRVLRKDRRTLVIACWKYADSNEIDDNTVCYTILRASIRTIDILENRQQWQPPQKTQTTSQPAPANSASGAAAKERPENVDTIPPK